MISAWDLNTTTPTAIAGTAITPFGGIDDTVDGLAFIPTFGGGGDPRQSQLVALIQAGEGAGQTVPNFPEPDFQIPAGQQVNFREDALKLYLLWSNSDFHFRDEEGPAYPGPTFNEAVFALGGAKVAGIHNGGGGLKNLSDLAQLTEALAPPGGLDIDGDGIVDIPEGEPLVFIVDGTGGGPAPNIAAIVLAVRSGYIADTRVRAHG